MTAGIGRFECKVLVHLFARLDLQGDRLAVLVELAARAFVDCELGTQHLGSGLHEPAHAVEQTRPGRLLAAGQRELEIATRSITFLLVADEAIREDSRHGLVVTRAAGVEPSVLLDQLEWIALPVFTLRFDDVDMREQQDRLGRLVPATQHSNQGTIVRRFRRRQDLHVSGRQSALQQALAHGFGCLRAIADGACRVDFDKFLVERPKRDFVGARALRLCVCQAGCDAQSRE